MSGEKKGKKPAGIKEDPARYLIDERYEIIGGVRYDFLSSPKYAHQHLLGRLYLAFHSACSQEGVVLFAPLDVHFDEENILQPDVIYIANENKGIIRDDYIFGAPDLVVEILSGSTARRDKTIKKDVYERFGVREYWLVDPNDRLIEQFVPVEGQYRLAATLSEKDRIVSSAIPCLSIDLSEVLAEE